MASKEMELVESKKVWRRRTSKGQRGRGRRDGKEENAKLTVCRPQATV